MAGEDQVSQILAQQADQNRSMMGNVTDNTALTRQEMNPMMTPQLFGDVAPPIDPIAEATRSQLGLTSFSGNAPMGALGGVFELGAFGVTASAIGGPLGIGAVAAAMLDPFDTGGLTIAGAASGVGAWMSASGLGEGAGLSRLASGGRALAGGARGIGGLAGGVGAGLAGGLAAYGLYTAATAVVDYATDNVNQGIMQQSNLETMLMSPNRTLMPEMGNVSSSDVLGVRNMFAGMSRNDPTLSVDQLTQVTGTLMGSGEFRDVKSMDEFKTKFRETLDALKDVASVMNSSLEEAYGFMESQKQMGIFGRGDQISNIMLTQGIAKAGGVDPSTVQQMGVFGANMYRAVGASPMEGAVMGEQMVGRVGMARRMGLIGDEDLYMATGMGGEQGAAMFSQQMSQQAVQFSQGRRGRMITAALMDPETGHIDPEVAQMYAGGGMGYEDVVSKARENLSTRRGKLAFRANRQQLAGELVQEVGPEMLIANDTENILTKYFGSTRLDPEEQDMARSIMQRRYTGMGDAQINMMMEMAQQGPEIRARTQMSMDRDIMGSGMLPPVQVPTLGGIYDSFTNEIFSPLSSGLQRIGANLQSGMTQWTEQQMFGGRVTVSPQTDTAFQYATFGIPQYGPAGSADFNAPGGGGGGITPEVKFPDAFGYMGVGAYTHTSTPFSPGNVSELSRQVPFVGEQLSRAPVPVQMAGLAGAQAFTQMATFPAALRNWITSESSTPDNVASIDRQTLKYLQETGAAGQTQTMTFSQLEESGGQYALEPGTRPSYQSYGDQFAAQERRGAQNMFGETGAFVVDALNEFADWGDASADMLNQAQAFIPGRKPFTAREQTELGLWAGAISGFVTGKVSYDEAVTMVSDPAIDLLEGTGYGQVGKGRTRVEVASIDLKKASADIVLLEKQVKNIDSELSRIDPQNITSEQAIQNQFESVGYLLEQGLMPGITSESLSEMPVDQQYAAIMGSLREGGFGETADRVSMYVGGSVDKKRAALAKFSRSAPMATPFAPPGMSTHGYRSMDAIVASHKNAVDAGNAAVTNSMHDGTLVKETFNLFNGKLSDIPQMTELAFLNQLKDEGGLSGDQRDRMNYLTDEGTAHIMSVSGVGTERAKDLLRVGATGEAGRQFAGAYRDDAEIQKQTSMAETRRYVTRMADSPAYGVLPHLRGGERFQTEIDRLQGLDEVTGKDISQFYDTVAGIAMDENMTAKDRESLAGLVQQMGPYGASGAHMIREAPRELARIKKLDRELSGGTEEGRERYISKLLSPHLSGDSGAAIKAFMTGAMQAESGLDLSSGYGIGRLMELAEGDPALQKTIQLTEQIMNTSDPKERRRLQDEIAKTSAQIVPPTTGTYAGGAAGEFGELLTRLDAHFAKSIELQTKQIAVLEGLSSEDVRNAQGKGPAKNEGKDGVLSALSNLWE